MGMIFFLRIHFKLNILSETEICIIINFVLLNE